MRQKYFQIGFDRCGTTAIAQFFNQNGIPCIHWDYGRLADTIERNLKESRFILSGYEHFDAFTHMSHIDAERVVDSFKRYPEILKQVPDAKFVLNTRDRENWIRSRLNMRGFRNGTFLDVHKRMYGVSDTSALIDLWREDWDAHHAAVQADIPPDQLLVFNIETDPPSSLYGFIGLDPTVTKPLKRVNGSLNPAGVFLSNWVPEGIKKALPDRTLRTLRTLLQKRT